MKKIPKKRINNPALEIKSFYTFANMVLNEINFARLDPSSYMQKLIKLKANNIDSIKKDILLIQNIPFKYKDLSVSIDSAIDFLKVQRSLPPLKYNKNISLGADKLLSFLILHDGMNMNEMSDPLYRLERRMKLCGEPFGEMLELIDYGTFDPEYIVLNFILSVGDPEMFERSIVFNEKITCVGIACGLLPSDRICTVIDFIELFYDPGDFISTFDKRKYEVRDREKLTYSVTTHNVQLDQKLKQGPGQKQVKESKEVKKKMTKKQNAMTPSKSKIRRRESGELFKKKRAHFIDTNLKTVFYIKEGEWVIEEEKDKEEKEENQDEEEEKEKEENQDEEEEKEELHVEEEENEEVHVEVEENEEMHEEEEENEELHVEETEKEELHVEEDEKEELHMEVEEKEELHVEEEEKEELHMEEEEEEEKLVEKEKKEKKKVVGEGKPIVAVDKDGFDKSDSMPEGGVWMKIKEKIIEDSNGVKVRLVKKIVKFEDGTINSYLFKKPFKK